jgi:aspartate/methionine/tyrosine aminotransferase
MIRDLKEKAEYASAALSSCGRLSLPKPEGAFYLFPGIDGVTDSFEFATSLLKSEKVAVAPGSAFGNGGEGSVRICYASDFAVLRPGIERFLRFVESA